MVWIRRDTGTREPKNARANRRVFYFGSGNTDVIGTGLDRVTSQHWRHLAASGMAVEGFIVSPGAETPSDRRSDGHRLRIYPPSWRASRGFWAKWRRRLSSLMRPHALFLGSSLHSGAVVRDVNAELRDVEPSVLVIDHFYSLQNIPLWFLLRSRVPILFIAHDHTPALIADLWAAQKPRRSLLAFLVDVAKARVVEGWLLRRADRLIFLSEFDAKRHPAVAHKSSALLPLEKPEKAGAARPTSVALPERFAVFLGSPSFAPNAEAIEWLVRDLAPVLAAKDPDCRIVLVGNRTQTIRGEHGNVLGLGYVSDEDLSGILTAAAALLSPIRHGSGLKIKIMDALTIGCPVIATEHALRGFEKFEIDRVIDLDDPGRCADMILDLASNAAARSDYSDALLKQVVEYYERHNDDLSKIVAALGG